MNKKLSIIFLLMFLFISSSSFAETIILKSGKTIEGKILEKTDKYIKVDTEGIPITYYMDEIKSIANDTLQNSFVPAIQSNNSLQQTETKVTEISHGENNKVITDLSSLGFIEVEGVRLPIEDFIITLKPDNSIWIDFFPFKLSQEERAEAIKDPHMFVDKVLYQSHCPEKWKTWTPVGYFSIALNNGALKGYSIGEHYILKPGENHFSGSSNKGLDIPKPDGLEIRKAELKHGGTVSIKFLGESKGKYGFKWSFDITGKIE